MPCGATQDGRVMVERSNRMWSTGEGNGKPLRILALRTPWTAWKGKKIGHWKMNSPGAQYATGDEWRNNSRKNEGMEPKQKQHPVVDGNGLRSKVWCCKEQYCIGTWNVRSTTQGTLEVVKQEMARANIKLDYRESWAPKNWCFWTVVLEKTLESPLDCKEIQPVHSKGDQSWVFIGRTDVEAEIPILWPPDGKSPWCWERLRAGREGDNRGWDGWMTSPTQWTWVE